MNHSRSDPTSFDDPARRADAVIEKIGKTIVLAMPLGVGSSAPSYNRHKAAPSSLLRSDLAIARPGEFA
jgi:hypothetical protein